MRQGVRTSDFVGRETEREALQGALLEAAAGRLRIALIEGEAGIGKTRLVEETLASSGARVFSAKCDEYEQRRAFAPLAEALGCRVDAKDPVRAGIADALSASESAEPRSRHHELADRFVSLIEAEAIDGPVALVIDDVQWADQATLAALRILPRRIPFVALFVSLMHRPVAASSSLGKLATVLRDQGAIHLTLTPLMDAEVARLARDRLGAQPDASLEHFLSGASGNPLFVREVLEALRQEGAIRIESGRAAVDQTAMPPDLRLTIIRRISYLPSDALDALRAAAILGSTFDPVELAAFSGTSVSKLAPSLDACSAAGILAPHGDQLRFRHDLIREALYLDRPAGVRSALHVEAARALKAARAPVARVAEQYALGARRGDREAIDAIWRAAGDERSAVTRLALLERALDLCESGDDASGAIKADLAEAMAAAGRPDDAAMIAHERLSSQPDVPIAQRMRAVITQTMRLGGRWVELAQLLDSWLAQDDLEDTERTELLASAAYAKGVSTAFDPEEAERVGRDALRRAEATGDPALIVQALLGVVWGAARLRVDAGDRDPADMESDIGELAERAVRYAETQPNEKILGMQPHWHLGRISFGDLDAAERAFRTGLRLAEQYGRLADAPLYLDGLAHTYFRGHRWDEAVTEAEAAVAAAEETGTLMSAAGSRALLAHIAICREELDAAEEHVSAEEALAAELGPGFDEAANAHRSMLREARGDLAGAFTFRWERFQRDVSEGRWPEWWYCLYLALVLADMAKAEVVVEYMEDRARSDSQRRGAALARAMLERNADAAYNDLDTVGGWDESIHEARAAVTLAIAGSPEEAKRRYERLVAMLDEGGADTWLDQVARRLQRHGVRLARRRRRARPESGWDALTPTEQRVARFAAEGLTNPKIAERLFVSPRTVQTHLAHVFRKLGISSRVELAAEVARRRDA